MRFNIEYKHDLLESHRVNLVAAVSEENGIESYNIFESSVNSEKFCSIIQDIKAHGDRAVIFGDNVSYHHSKYTKNLLSK